MEVDIGSCSLFHNGNVGSYLSYDTVHDNRQGVRYREIYIIFKVSARMVRSMAKTL